MSSIKLKTAWKEKVEPNNFFDDIFLNEKDKALQPISELFETTNDIPSNNDKIPLNNINEEKIKKKSLKSFKESDLYDSNIVIIQTVSENESELTAMNQFEKEVEKINKIILKKKLKKAKKKSKSKSKKIES
jgi:hypothetical protein